MDRSHSHSSHHSHDGQAIRSSKSYNSGNINESGRVDAMSLARPKSDKEIEDRFVEFMVGCLDISSYYFNKNNIMNNNIVTQKKTQNGNISRAS